jgi:hypothetical protein
MSHDYSTAVSLDHTPEGVYDAVIDVRGSWSENVSETPPPPS